MVRGSCLCGDVVFEIEAGQGVLSHCHCSRCRKSHGAAFGSYLLVGEGAFRLREGIEAIVAYPSSAGFSRPFCGRCGSVVPDGVPFQGRVGLPAGPLDGDPGVRPVAHIFVASKAPWFDPRDGLPRFDAYPPGFDAPVLADRAPLDPPGGTRGSCLCGAVTYRVEGPVRGCHSCHCSRCRKARAAAHASNLFTRADDVRFTRGADRLVSYKLPDARYFTQTFCGDCGSPLPRIDRERDLAVVPMGGLDDDPGARPERHIFVASKAPWYEIADDLPRFDAYPPGT
jgi:hypothetical protein